MCVRDDDECLNVYNARAHTSCFARLRYGANWFNMRQKVCVAFFCLNKIIKRNNLTRAKSRWFHKLFELCYILRVHNKLHSQFYLSFFLHEPFSRHSRSGSFLVCKLITERAGCVVELSVVLLFRLKILYKITLLIVQGSLFRSYLYAFCCILMLCICF